MKRILLLFVLAFCFRDARSADTERGPKLTDRWRYSEWTNGKGERAGVELYDEQRDPHEDTNLASQPENSAVISELATQLHNGWRAALPKPFTH